MVVSQAVALIGGRDLGRPFRRTGSWWAKPHRGGGPWAGHLPRPERKGGELQQFQWPGSPL